MYSAAAGQQRSTVALGTHVHKASGRSAAFMSDAQQTRSRVLSACRPCHVGGETWPRRRGCVETGTDCGSAVVDIARRSTAAGRCRGAARIADRNDETSTRKSHQRPPVQSDASVHLHCFSHSRQQAGAGRLRQKRCRYFPTFCNPRIRDRQRLVARSAGNGQFLHGHSHSVGPGSQTVSLTPLKPNSITLAGSKPNSITLSGSNQLRTSSKPSSNQIV